VRVHNRCLLVLIEKSIDVLGLGEMEGIGVDTMEWRSFVVTSPG
jgi:hypothetical protein